MTATLTTPAHRRAPLAGRVLLGSGDAPRWSRPALWGVLAAAFALYAWALSGDANAYYAAAVRSGTTSWKAFFFGALDAGSFITVDKPPLALWVMGLSARIFGYGTYSMLLPQAVAGAATVALVHSAVRRGLGTGRHAHVAALVAAVVMTLTPITVAINRDNNPDTLLVLLLVAAGWCCLEALRAGRPRLLLLCALLVGLAFNTKMLQAYLAVPALASAYLVCARTTLARRLGHLLAAGAVLVAASAWWMAIVDLWPADSRPYIGGSTDNSVWDLVIGYNGLGRIFGQGGGSGGFGGGASFGGASGAGRLFNDTMAGQISWLLPFCALASALAAVAAWSRWRARREPATPVSSVLRQPGAPWLLWGVWLAVHFAVFSFSSGTFHPYYTTAMAPAVAALTGMGAVLMWRAHRHSRAWWWVLPLAVAVTGGWSFTVLRRTPDWVPWLAWTVLAATVLASAGLVLARLGRGTMTRLAVSVLPAVLVAGLAGPAAYAVTPLQSPVNGTNPIAGPAVNSAPGGGFGPGGSGMRGTPPREAPPGTRQPDQPGQGEAGRPGRMAGGFGGETDSALVAYLEANQGTAEWLAAVASAQQAAGIILATGKPVIAMGGFTGRDPAMTVARLQSLVASGRLRHVLTGGGGPGRGDSEVTTWVQRNCAAVTGQDGLYDCSAAG
ncbi:4-amino-4-deoxy-L-arabinose transferase-like glycosyltransferase [Nonomuraea muscovyensis]|uniref:4-amino-4-deoxy-L-arabinose transferase-like glycosyltransferase n=1 Tax=Nonomuraea muscovyensis TaxID=1124761 RepID=A0A7X0C5F7_9ACTN|nr:glycosyltransferase family 39 protein [Nonomuraea muscovyensis]MBB6348883.1 4-amino-4-deoxy-L-arabinose transferase-like glycosyltransferase [Nonomuraea muscovyensis]